jgi:hypothetical protein
MIKYIINLKKDLVAYSEIWMNPKMISIHKYFKEQVHLYKIIDIKYSKIQ